MIGLGTLINVAAIVVGGGIGLAGGKRLSSRAQQTLIRGMAVCVLFVAIGGVMEEMLVVENGALRTRGTLMLVVDQGGPRIAKAYVSFAENLVQFFSTILDLNSLDYQI